MAEYKKGDVLTIRVSVDVTVAVDGERPSSLAEYGLSTIRELEPPVVVEIVDGEGYVHVETVTE